MGSATSNQARQLPPPEDIAQFRKLAAPGDEYIIPEVPEKRKLTDKHFLYVLGICLGLLAIFLIYTLVHADMDRFTHGYDRCGNVCGKKNSPVDDVPCSGKDMTAKPFLVFAKSNDPLDPDGKSGGYQREDCVESCGPNYQIVFNLCFPIDSDKNQESFNEFAKVMSDIAHDINKSAGSIVLLCFVGLGFSIGMLVLFRYFVAVVVWVILIGSMLALIVFTIFLWILAGRQTNGDKSGPQAFAIVFTIVSVVLVIMLVCMFKRIKLVIRLFKEAIKVIFGIPLILIEPLLTLLASLILGVIFIFILLLIDSSGTLQKVQADLYDYTPNGAMLFTLFFHVLMSLWMSQFILGCQHMVISGSVSAYYFTRDKATLSSPIYNSFYNLVKYHLGTVAFGSLIITAFAVIKALIKSLVNNRTARAFIECCLGSIEDFLKYLSKNAYIQTAMHGQAFYKSGKRAVRLLAANALSAIAVNSVGDFVLGMAGVLIILATVAFGLLIDDGTVEHFWAAILIAAIVTAVIVDCFFSVFETTIDTIFLSFCEDSLLNDGMARPYYMSRDLMQYIEEAKTTTKN